MVNPQHSIRSLKTGLAETAARRDAWTPGRAVRLADGGWWRLPQVDCTLLLVHEDLPPAISRAFELAEAVGQAEPDATRHLIAAASYHAQLAQLAVVLLQLNYDLPERRWRQLFSLEHLDAMLRLTLAVSEVVADAIPAWMPFHWTSGPAGAENLLRN